MPSLLSIPDVLQFKLREDNISEHINGVIGDKDKLEGISCRMCLRGIIWMRTRRFRLDLGITVISVWFRGIEFSYQFKIGFGSWFAYSSGSSGIKVRVFILSGPDLGVESGQ